MFVCKSVLIKCCSLINVFMLIRCVVPDDFLGGNVVRPLRTLPSLLQGQMSAGRLEAAALPHINEAVHPSCEGDSRSSKQRNVGQRCLRLTCVSLPSMCLTVCEEISQRPVWRATMLAVAVELLIRPTEETLCPFCWSTWPFM